MIAKKLVALGILLAAAIGHDLLVCQSGLARGFGGGGGRGGGGGFRGGGGFDRGGYGGYDRGAGGYDRGAGGFDRGGGIGRDNGMGRDDLGRNDFGNDMDRAFNGYRNEDARDFADKSWNTDTMPHLSTDGGFAHAATNLNPANLVHAGNSTYNMSRGNLNNIGHDVRNNFNHYNAFDRNWWNDHQGAWNYGWMNGGYVWGATAWPDLEDFWGLSDGSYGASGPTEYDYGNNITYQGDTVYYGQQPIGSSEQYYDQAQTLADSAPPYSSPPPSNGLVIDPPTPLPAGEQKSDWKPFGVFSLVQGTQSDSSTVFQLMANKKGVIGGNYYNTLTDEVKPVSGAIDKKTMRAAWTVAGNKSVVYDTGVSNLLKQQSPVLVHFGKNRTQQWTLVKIQQQKQATSASST